MNSLLRVILLLSFGTALVAPTALQAADDSHADHTPKAGAPAPAYQCPMHPWIKSDKPGSCTICGMKLVLAGAAQAAAPGTVTFMPSMITTIGLESSRVTRQPLSRTLRVNGRIDDDDTRHRIISARVPGRIERLDITYLGQKVEAGAPLATIYSPEILSAQRVYLERLRAGEGAFPVAERAAARERLLELGLTEADVIALEKSQKASAVVPIRAPVGGTVVSKSVYEGQYVQTSDRLFEIADFSSMWFVFEIYEQDIPWVRTGQTVEITTRAVPGEIITGPVAFIDPNFDETTRTTRARVVINNPHPASLTGQDHFLPHRVPAQGRVLLESPAVLAAPRSAILDAGRGPVAYVEVAAGQYEARKIRVGRRGDALVEILDGLQEGENVVTTGALLVDAQAQLQHEAAGHSHGGAAPASSAAAREVSDGRPRPTETAPTSDNSGETGLAALARVAIEGANALAADDYAAYQKSFPALARVAAGYPALPKLAVGDNLRAARASFEPWSTAVADLLKPHREQLGLKVFQCPMTPVLGKGRWVQRSQPARNPFFGSAMADCGTELP
jgi:Cu(I)/Ag(I) efflux system membrane fusion protein